MNKVIKILVLFLALTAISAVFISVYRSIHEKQGLVHYFAGIGIEIDYMPLIVLVALIPVFWIIALIIRTWTAE